MISIKDQSEINIMRQGGRILAEILAKLVQNCHIGANAFDLEQMAQKLIVQAGAKPSFMGFQGYKYAICVSKNEEVVHGLPLANKIFNDGDIISIDIGINFKGFHTDGAKTIGIGRIKTEEKKLIEVTQKALQAGINKIKNGIPLGQVSQTIEQLAKQHNFGVFKDLTGHGIGRNLQEEPPIYNFGNPQDGPILQEGMTLALEPMLTLGSYKIKTLSDNWTVVSRDGQKSAHFEDTVLVLANNAEILTK